MVHFASPAPEPIQQKDGSRRTHIEEGQLLEGANSEPTLPQRQLRYEDWKMSRKNSHLQKLRSWKTQPQGRRKEVMILMRVWSRIPPIVRPLLCPWKPRKSFPFLRKLLAPELNLSNIIRPRESSKPLNT